MVSHEYRIYRDRFLFFEGTGCFILYNTGEDIAYSRNGLLTTVAYQWNNAHAVYALEVRRRKRSSRQIFPWKFFSIRVQLQLQENVSNGYETIFN